MNRALVPSTCPKRLSTRDFFFHYKCGGYEMKYKDKIALWKNKSKDEKNLVKKECKVLNDGEAFLSDG